MHTGSGSRGVIFSILTLLGYSSGLCVLELDTTLQNVFMTVFFTAVGFTCDLKVLYKYGMRGIQFAIIVFLLVIFQNIIGVVMQRCLISIRFSV